LPFLLRQLLAFWCASHLAAIWRHRFIMATMTELKSTSQLALDLGRAEAFARDDLVVTPANAAAIDVIDRWPNWPGTVAILTGPHGSGKSHMAKAWAQKANATELPANALGQLPDDVSAVLIDPLMGEDNVDETGLFHLINALKAKNGHVLLTSLLPIASHDIALADLKSRLDAATQAEIAMPDDALLSGLIAKGFADRQLFVEPDVVAYLAHRIERSAAAARQIVAVIDAEALARKSRITRAFVGQVVKSLDADEEPMLF
jgi:chromosomal replication initiation ATPase DnaA